MKLFDIDWHDFFRRLPVWQRLSAQARLAFARMQPSQPQPLARFSGEHHLLVESGYMTLERGGPVLRLKKECWPFAATIRLIVNGNLLGTPSPEAMHKYLIYQFTADHRAALCTSMGLAGWQADRMEHLAMSTQWLETFLAASTSDLKLSAPKPERRGYPSWLLSPAPQAKPAPPRPVIPLATLKGVIRCFMSWPEPVPMAELSARLPDLAPETLAGAVAMGVDRLLLFPGLWPEDMTLILGLWPAITRRLHRIKLAAPAEVRPAQTFDGAFLMEDMTTTLVATTAKPLRLRGHDDALFAKAQRDLEADLMPFPPWVLAALEQSPSRRVAVALDWLQRLGLAQCVGVPGEDLRLQATRKGEAWLAETAKGRLKGMLDHFLAGGKKKNRPSTRSVAPDDGEDEAEVYDHYPRSVNFLPFTIRTSSGERHNKELRRAVVSAFKTLPGEAFVSLADFLDWQALEENPLPAMFAGDDRQTVYFNRSDRPATIEELEGLWRQGLLKMLAERLLPLGCARLGLRSESDGICFALTGAGRYLLGLAEDFDYGHDHDAQGSLVVQPNFEIVFLSPSPLAEATLARFAERKGRGVGALFAISKKSILSAAGSGLTVAAVLETLQRLSAKPIPANVTREIAGWFDQCRRIAVRAAILIHCPDANTAARVIAASGPKAVALTDTVVELADAGAQTELLRKLHGLGIFTQSPASSSQPRGERSPATRRRRFRRW